jgi:hypothetical protein
MDLKHWRDLASHYDSDPGTSMLTVDEKMRLVALSLGVKDALTLPVDILGDKMRDASKHPDPNWWGLSDSKKREINNSASAINKGAVKPRAKMMGA